MTQPPSPGWYPDPALDSELLRWWNGTGWTEHTSAATTPPSVVQGGPGPSYVPDVSPLAPSGMRRLPELFNDAGRILRRGWWRIALWSLVVWAVWLVISGLVVSIFVDFGAFSRALDNTSTQLEIQGTGPIPETVRDELASQWQEVLRIDSVFFLIVGGILLALVYSAALVLQVSLVNSIALDAAVGRDLVARIFWPRAVGGAVRLFGYYIVLAVILLAAFAVAFIFLWLALAGVDWNSANPTPNGGWLAAFIIYVFLYAFVVIAFSLFLAGRLSPVLVQTLVGRRSLAWSWQATRGKFWAVLGRYLLWSLVAGFALQFVTSILTSPLYFLPTTASGEGVQTVVWLALGTSILTIVIASALQGLALIGLVPIWRDLTDLPEYRSITQDGQLVPRPDQSGSS